MFSALGETCGKWDLGPVQRNSSIIAEDAAWLSEWTQHVIRAARLPAAALERHRTAMMADALARYSWEHVAARLESELTGQSSQASHRILTAQQVATHYVELGSAFMTSRSRIGSAVSMLQHALRVLPTLWVAYANLAVAKMRVGDNDGSIEASEHGMQVRSTPCLYAQS